MLLQNYPWETNADNFRTFMQSIRVDGGWGEEAIEIGLWHAVKESVQKDFMKDFNKRFLLVMRQHKARIKLFIDETVVVMKHID